MKIGTANEVSNCKLFYLTKYAVGILFILSSAFLPLWAFCVICLIMCVLSLTPVLSKIAYSFRLTDESKRRQLSFDFKILAGMLAITFIAATLLEKSDLAIGIPWIFNLSSPGCDHLQHTVLVLIIPQGNAL